MLKKTLITLILTLLLSSCAGLGERKIPPNLLTRPNLESAIENEQGGICLDKEDTAELLHYLDGIEKYVAEGS